MTFSAPWAWEILSPRLCVRPPVSPAYGASSPLSFGGRLCLWGTAGHFPLLCLSFLTCKQGTISPFGLPYTPSEEGGGGGGPQTVTSSPLTGPSGNPPFYFWN